jgi:hypothetical protein
VFNLDMESTLMGNVLDDKMKPDAAAKAWLKKNPQVFDTWLAGVTTIDGKPGLEAVKARLLSLELRSIAYAGRRYARPGCLFPCMRTFTTMLIDQKIPLGQYIAGFVEWLTQHGANTFDAIAVSLETMIHGVTFALTWFNPLVLIGLIALLAHFIQRKWGLTAFVIASFLLILNLGYWQETMETLAQVLFATLVCVVIGVPLGIVAAHKPMFYTLMRPVLDLMQTVPTFVYLIPTLTLFGLGVVPGLISTVVFAIAAPHPSHLPGYPRCAARTDGRRQGLRLLASPTALTDRTAPRHAEHRGRHHPVHHAVVVDGGDRRTGRRRRTRQTGGQRTEHC